MRVHILQGENILHTTNHEIWYKGKSRFVYTGTEHCDNFHTFQITLMIVHYSEYCGHGSTNLASRLDGLS